MWDLCVKEHYTTLSACTHIRTIFQNNVRSPPVSPSVFPSLSLVMSLSLSLSVCGLICLEARTSSKRCQRPDQSRLTVHIWIGLLWWQTEYVCQHVNTAHIDQSTNSPNRICSRLSKADRSTIVSYTGLWWQTEQVWRGLAMPPLFINCTHTHQTHLTPARLAEELSDEQGWHHHIPECEMCRLVF